MTGTCWCWQFGRCLDLSACPTAAHPRPVPFIDSVWKDAALRLQYPTRFGSTSGQTEHGRGPS